MYNRQGRSQGGPGVPVPFVLLKDILADGQ